MHLYGWVTLGSEAHTYKRIIAALTSGYVAYVLVKETTDSFVLYKGEGHAHLRHMSMRRRVANEWGRTADEYKYG